MTAPTEEPICDAIRQGRMRASIYLTARQGRPAYTVECFRWHRSSSRSKWNKLYRYDHERDFHAVATYLETADQWIIQDRGRPSPASEHGPTETHVRLTSADAAALLHLLLTVRSLQPHSDPLAALETRLSEALTTEGPNETQHSTSLHAETPLYEDIEQLRQTLTKTLP